LVVFQVSQAHDMVYDIINCNWVATRW